MNNILHEETRYSTDVTQVVDPSTTEPSPLVLWFPTSDRPLITDPEAAVRQLLPHYYGLDREACITMMLDTKHKMLGTKIISLGNISNTFMSSREIYRDALLANASAIIVSHNHPSGSPEPSDDDAKVTQGIIRAGELLHLEMLDHIVFAGEQWTSMARRGII